MTERPANLDDMRRFWPDKTDDELQAAADAIAAAGGTLNVGPAKTGYRGAMCDRPVGRHAKDCVPPHDDYSF